jgi:hypothetical protein
MIEDNVKDLKGGHAEIPEAIPDDKDKIRVIPESQKDLDPRFRLQHQRPNETRVSFL